MAVANLTVRISAQIADLQKEMKQASATIDRFTKDFDTSVTKSVVVGSLLSRAIGALPGLVIGAVSSFVDLTSQLTDLSARTGIAVRDLQRFAAAGDLVGVSMDQITAAVAQMQNRLAGGDKGAVAAIATLGLELSAIRQLDPGQQFEAIAAAISKIKDPAERTRVAMEIFGRSGSVLLPILRTNLKEVGDEAERSGRIMSNELVKSGDSLGDSWSRLTKAGSSLIGLALSPLIPILEKASEGVQNAIALYQKLQKVIGDFSTKGFAQGVTLPTVAAKPLSRGEVPVPQIKPSDLDGISRALDKQRGAMEKARDAADDYAASVRELRREFSGAALQQEVNRVADAVKGLTAAQLQQPATLDRVSTAVRRLWDEGAKLTPELFHILVTTQSLIPVTDGLGREFEKLGTSFEMTHIPMLSVTDGLGDLWGKYGDVVTITGVATEKTEDWGTTLNDLSQTLAQLAQVAGDTFGGMVSQLSTIVSAANAAKTSVKSLQDGVRAMKTGDTLEGILGITTGILGIVSAAISAGRAIAGLLDRNKGRDLVEEFAADMGGFDALHAQLLELGEAGELLWIKLTQGVGRNNPAQAQAAIDEVTAALDEQRRRQDEATVSTEAGAQATIETATQASLALDEVSAKLLENMGVWDTWSDHVTGKLQTLADNIRALPIPMPSFSYETPAQRAPSMGDLGVDGERWQTTINLDGEVIARNTARRLPDVVHTAV